MAMEKVLLSLPADMKSALEREAKRRKLPGLQDLIRLILSEHLTGT